MQSNPLIPEMLLREGGVDTEAVGQAQGAPSNSPVHSIAISPRPGLRFPTRSCLFQKIFERRNIERRNKEVLWQLPFTRSISIRA